MSERATFDLPYPAPERANEIIAIDETVTHIDILLPYSQERWQDGMRWVTAVRKALRLSRIDERSLVLTDLSSLPNGHDILPPHAGSEIGLPHDVMDIYPDEAQQFGRSHNPADLPILRSELVSRNHFSITPRLGEAGLSLAILDLSSVNGSGVRVQHDSTNRDDAFDRLYA